MATKKLCEWKKKDLEKNFDDYVILVADSKFVCAKCGRAANDKKSLCKPKALK